MKYTHTVTGRTIEAAPGTFRAELLAADDDWTDSAEGLGERPSSTSTEAFDDDEDQV